MFVSRFATILILSILLIKRKGIQVRENENQVNRSRLNKNETIRILADGLEKRQKNIFQTINDKLGKPIRFD